MLFIRSMLYNALFYVVMAVMGIVCMPAAIVSRHAAWWTVRTYCALALFGLRVICGLRTEVRGEVPTGEVLIAAKHQSFLDVLIIAGAVPRPRFVMKRSLRWAPILGVYGIRIGCISVNRGARGKAVRKMLDDMAKAGVVDPQTIIYPQGTRVAPGAEKPYKIGAAALFEAFGMDCIPAATNAGVFWGRHTINRHPGLAVVEFLPMIPAGYPRAEFMEKLKTTVEAASDKLLAEAGGAVGISRSRLT